MIFSCSKTETIIALGVTRVSKIAFFAANAFQCVKNESDAPPSWATFPRACWTSKGGPDVLPINHWCSVAGPAGKN